MKRAAAHVQAVKQDDLWETPPELFDEFCQKHNLYLELDVCATKQSRKCRNYFGPDYPNYDPRHDAFLNLWDKDFFCNPPYSNKEDWIAYGIEQAMAHGVTGVFLIYAKTDTQWWHDLVVENRDIMKVYFQKGRIPFLKNGTVPVTEKLVMMRPDGTKITKKVRSSAPYGSAWLVIKHNQL